MGEKNIKIDSKTPFVILKLDTTGKNKEEFIELIELTLDNAFEEEVKKYRDVMNESNSYEDTFKYIIADCKAKSEKSKMMRQFRQQVDIIYDKTKTDSGANVIGGAKPAKSYPSLGLAQDAFKDYLGLHNQIESLTDEVYQLTGIMIVNTDDFMQAIYSYNSDDEKIIKQSLLNYQRNYQ